MKMLSRSPIRELNSTQRSSGLNTGCPWLCLGFAGPAAAQAPNIGHPVRVRHQGHVVLAIPVAGAQVPAVTHNQGVGGVGLNVCRSETGQQVLPDPGTIRPHAAVIRLPVSCTFHFVLETHVAGVRPILVDAPLVRFLRIERFGLACCVPPPDSRSTSFAGTMLPPS